MMDLRGALRDEMSCLHIMHRLDCAQQTAAVLLRCTVATSHAARRHLVRLHVF
jgi:hypothetical protein